MGTISGQESTLWYVSRKYRFAKYLRPWLLALRDKRRAGGISSVEWDTSPTKADGPSSVLVDY